MSTQVNETVQDIFQRACIVQCNFSIFGETRKIPKKITQEMAKLYQEKYKGGNGNEEEKKKLEWIRGSKKLFDPESLKPIKAVRTKVKTYLEKVGTPFPIDSMDVISKELIQMVDDKLNEFLSEWNTEVHNWSLKYPELRENAKKFLPEGFFDPLQYPEDIKSKFSFTWRFIAIDTPGASILTPEIYKREVDKLIRTIDEAKDMGVQAIRDQFISLIDHFVDRMTPNEDGTPKKFHDSTRNNFFEFFELFKQRNIFDDRELEGVVNKAKEILSKVNCNNLREYEPLRDKIAQDFGTLKSMIDENIEDMPKRRLII